MFCDEIVRIEQERYVHSHNTQHTVLPSRLVHDSGKGKWKEIATMIPTRSTIQVKTHAQQIIKRVEAGEDIYAYLESQPTTATTTTSPPTPTTTTAKSDGFEDSFQMSRRKVSYDSDQDIDAALRELSQKDHGAVEILYQMTQKSTVRAELPVN